ncbi:switch-associated protein 70-like isoform X2 [Dreissena polymorpha]|uniref:switch-associated protein 70-like isoform X2 n=1 Tax=Dreissena polymorpha TaxID=45954 RepID=UPI0022656058|nr:switch-associated protein 70-like isoform X2 [Dreissena polymorpha]
MALFRATIRRGGGETSDHEHPVDMEDSPKVAAQELKKAIWHAFNMLDVTNTGVVHVSQLRVITASIGMKFGINKAEEFLNHDEVTEMDFSTYFEIVRVKLINDETNTMRDTSHAVQYDAIKICWRFCDFERTHKSVAVTTEHCFVLWRLFNFLSETDDNEDAIIPVMLHPEEAALVFRGFLDTTGQKAKEHIVESFIRDSADKCVTYSQFLDLFEKEFIQGLTIKHVSDGLNQLSEKYLTNILMKGMIHKRGYKHKSWKDRWLVLTPIQLRYYVNSQEKLIKGSITFDDSCKIRVQQDRPTSKQNRFILETSKKPYEMSAADVKTKNEWVAALEEAIGRVGKDPHIQREATRARCCARRQRRQQTADEERRRQEETEFLNRRLQELDEEKKKRLADEELLKARMGELEAERKKREEAEARWQEELALREAEQQRLRELQAIKEELERLLAEERQAKRDEEIVRNLQSRLLEEESEKRSELERLQQKQEEMLRAEREQKAVLESDRKEQERLLADAKMRLRQLEEEQAEASSKMQATAEKLQKAENDRKIMEEKAQLWKRPIGLAKPVQPTFNPLISHRGQGAFCQDDFVKRERDKEPNADKSGNDSDEQLNGRCHSPVPRKRVIVRVKEEAPKPANIDNKMGSKEDLENKPDEQSIEDCNMLNANGGRPVPQQRISARVNDKKDEQDESPKRTEIENKMEPREDLQEKTDELSLKDSTNAFEIKADMNRLVAENVITIIVSDENTTNNEIDEGNRLNAVNLATDETHDSVQENSEGDNHGHENRKELPDGDHNLQGKPETDVTDYITDESDATYSQSDDDTDDTGSIGNIEDNTENTTENQTNEEI